MTLKAHASKNFNPRKSTDYLPLELRPSFPPKMNGGGGRIRTFEGVSRQIYSLLPLAAWVPLPGKTSRVFSFRPPGVSTGLARILLCNFGPPAGGHLYIEEGPGLKGQPKPRWRMFSAVPAGFP